ncbi:MAG: hypothetical protein E7316_10070 [Clostridiales bacterium]|nr:hypothetical protein [Clostridiales bacterium]
MMNGYSKDDALAFILPRIDRKGHKALTFLIDQLIAQAIDADMAFMHATGVLDENGDAGDNYYDDDEAFEYIVEALAELNGFDPDMAVKVGGLIDDYMELQQEYLEHAGLIDWE